ncbi:MAG: hypothetical protein HQK54_18655, partial [Oligoflexales bacterium]|nr:hypothetical protein [Oligoflexales bacterium]
MRLLKNATREVFAVMTLSICLSCGTDKNTTDGSQSSDQTANQADATSNNQMLAELGLDENGNPVIGPNEADKNHRPPFSDEVIQGLSDAAKATFQTVENNLKDLNAQREQICPRDFSLRDKIGSEIKAVHGDASLSNTQKRQKTAEIISAYKDQIKAERTNFKNCLDTNSAALKVIDDKARTITKSCLFTFSGRKEGMPGGAPVPQGKPQVIPYEDQTSSSASASFEGTGTSSQAGAGAQGNNTGAGHP